MTSKINRFAGVARGRPLCGSKAIAGFIWDDEARWRSAFRLPRDEYGLAVVCGELLGFTGWINHALAAGAKRRRQRRALAAEAAGEMKETA
jgi:hypothetical protein